MSAQPGVSLTFPARATSGSHVPFKVVMTADMATYYAVNGILDRALEVILVRRDRPGVRFLAKVDPRAYMLPEPPLPPAPPGDSPEAKVRVTEEKTVDLLDYGATHYGAASYQVFASFGPFVTDIRPLDVADARRSLPWGTPERAPPLPDPGRVPLPEPPALRGLAASIVRRERFRVEGALRVPIHAPRFKEEPPSEPFVTIVAVRRVPEGGATAGSFLVAAKEDGPNHTAVFSVPFADLAAGLPPGPCRVFVFSGDFPPVMRDFLWGGDD